MMLLVVSFHFCFISSSFLFIYYKMIEENELELKQIQKGLKGRLKQFLDLTLVKTVL